MSELKEKLHESQAEVKRLQMKLDAAGVADAEEEMKMSTMEARGPRVNACARANARARGRECARERVSA
eukprot:6172881-Pleurochrysis_carterae.AAC.2